MRLIIGSDHGGFHLKAAIVKELEAAGHQVTDAGTHTADPVDYPDIASSVARKVGEGEFPRGILVCGTGVGMSISANKVKGVRAAVVSDTFSAKMTRAHNDANILCLGERVVGVGLASELVKAFLSTEFEGGRHEKRVDKIRQLESGGGSRC
jgi:ribose 5-phosphate isomerase B